MDPADRRYPWVAMAVVLVGTTMVMLDTTIINVALPAIADDLGAGAGIEWVVTAYLLGVVMTQPVTGWVADRLGRKRTFLGALVVFTVASMLAAMAPDLGTLIATRILQGWGGGAMVPVGMAMIYELFPEERRGRALGIWGVAAMAAPAIGPVFGGWLATAVDWHWLFLVNLPIGVIGFVAGVRLLRDTGYRQQRAFDRRGWAVGTVGFSAAILGISESARWGFTDLATIVCVIGGVALLVWFFRIEGRVAHPMLDLTILREPVFTLGLVLVGFAVAAQFTRLVFLPQQLEALRGYTPLEVGWIMAPGAVAAAIAMPIGGRLVDRLGARTPVMLGFATMAVGVAGLSQLSTTTPIWQIIAALVLQGVGMGCIMIPTTVAGMNLLPPRQIADAAALRSLATQVAAAVAVAVFSALFTGLRPSDGNPAGIESAFNTLYLVALGGVVLGLAGATRLPRRPTRRADGLAPDEPSEPVAAPVVLSDH